MDWDILRYVIVASLGLTPVPFGIMQVRLGFHNQEVATLNLMHWHMTDPVRYYHEVHILALQNAEEENTGQQ